MANHRTFLLISFPLGLEKPPTKPFPRSTRPGAGDVSFSEWHSPGSGVVHASRRRVPDRQHFNYFGACKSSGATPLSNRLSVRVGGCACGFHINLSLPSFNLLKPAIIQSIIHKQSRSRSRNGKTKANGRSNAPMGDFVFCASAKLFLEYRCPGRRRWSESSDLLAVAMFLESLQREPNSARWGFKTLAV